MRTFKLTVAYDGTDFAGWQVQLKHKTIASCMQNVFYKTFNQKISLLGASRTDAGVHALGQVAKFKADLKISDEKILEIWNRSLPKSILIRKLETVSSEFHPHKNVLQKTYYYNLFLQRPMPFLARYGWLYNFINQVDLQKYNHALQLYLGEHDFASFCKIEEKHKSTIRTIDSITLSKLEKFGAIQVKIQGKSFLRFQIRRMIGYALDISRKKTVSLEYLKEILDNPNPKQKLLKAEGCGLILRKVDYKNGSDFEKRNF
jgi:tRNA pseudouridine38-40 synthase